VLGVDAVMRLGRPRLAGLALAAVVASWIGAGIAMVVVCRAAEPSRVSILRAADAIRRDAAGRPCAAVAALAPQLMWYARCAIYPAELGMPLPADRARYAVSFPRWPIRLDATLAAQHLRATPIATGDPDAEVWRLE